MSIISTLNNTLMFGVSFSGVFRFGIVGNLIVYRSRRKNIRSRSPKKALVISDDGG